MTYEELVRQKLTEIDIIGPKQDVIVERAKEEFTDFAKGMDIGFAFGTRSLWRLKTSPLPVDYIAAAMWKCVEVILRKESNGYKNDRQKSK